MPALCVVVERCALGGLHLVGKADGDYSHRENEMGAELPSQSPGRRGPEEEVINSAQRKGKDSDFILSCTG